MEGQYRLAPAGHGHLHHKTIPMHALPDAACRMERASMNKFAKFSLSVVPLHPLLGIALAACTFASQAQSAPSATPPHIVTLAPVAVSGVLPGPALWKVSKGDHVMWVLGVVQPLPKKMQWESARIQGLVAASQEVLKAPGLAVGAHVGFWGRLFLIPSMIGIKKLPDRKTLRDVLSPVLYGRWAAQKSKYLNGSWRVERLRPIFAGEKLYEAAVDRSDLTSDKSIEKTVLGFAKESGIKITDTTYVMIMKDPRADAKLFKQVTLDDQQCLSGILDATEHDLSQATLRANAWATGDLQALRKVLADPQEDQCLSALGNTSFAKKVGMTDIAGHMRHRWVEAAERAIGRNRRTVALLPMEQIIARDGYLSTLQSDGYTVTAPGSETGSTAPDLASGQGISTPMSPDEAHRME